MIISGRIYPEHFINVVPRHLNFYYAFFLSLVSFLFFPFSPSSSCPFYFFLPQYFHERLNSCFYLQIDSHGFKVTQIRINVRSYSF